MEQDQEWVLALSCQCLLQEAGVKLEKTLSAFSFPSILLFLFYGSKTLLNTCAVSLQISRARGSKLSALQRESAGASPSACELSGHTRAEQCSAYG